MTKRNRWGIIETMMNKEELIACIPMIDSTRNRFYQYENKLHYFIPDSDITMYLEGFYIEKRYLTFEEASAVYYKENFNEGFLEEIEDKI